MGQFVKNFRNYKDILNSNPQELFDWIDDKYMEAIPESLETPDELLAAGNRLGELTNIYSYLMSMVTLSNMQLRNTKKDKDKKDEAIEMMNRKDVLQNAAEIIKMQYTAISRMITVKKQADEEINMSK
jgi:hypothetical protein